VTRRRWLSWFALMALALAIQYHGLFVRRYDVPDIGAGERPRQIALHAGVTVRQTFRVHAEGLHAVVIETRRTPARASGEVVFEIEARHAGEYVPLYRIVRPAHGVASARRVRVGFPVVETPRLRDFRLTITAPTVAEEASLALLATRAPVYPEGRLHVSDRQVWGDLAFGARARGDTAYAQLRARLRGVPVLGWPGVVPALLGAYDVVLGLFLWLACSDARRSRAASDDLREAPLVAAEHVQADDH
jgi:hypothetical protein